MPEEVKEVKDLSADEIYEGFKEKYPEVEEAEIPVEEPEPSVNPEIDSGDQEPEKQEDVEPEVKEPVKEEEQPEPAEVEAGEASDEGEPEVKAEEELDTPANKAFAEMRIEKKALKEKLEAQEAEFNAKLAALEARISEPTTQPEQPKVTAQDAFNVLRVAREGGYASDAENQQNERLALEAISQLSAAELAPVLQGAINNQYGDLSGEIAQVANQAVTLAQTRESQDNKLATEEQNKQTEVLKQKSEQHAKELSSVKESDPTIFDPDHEDYKKFAEWVEKNIGKVNATGTGFEVKGSLPEYMVNELLFHPADQVKMFRSQTSKADQSELEKARAELAAIKKKHNIIDSPETGSKRSSAQVKTKSNRSADDILNDFKKRY